MVSEADCGDGEMSAAVGGGANAFDCSCSANCQCSHIECGTKCASTELPSALTGREVSQLSGVRSSEINKQSNEIMFPYEEFIQLFNWEKPGYPPCGLINGGNSCYANVVLQCLTYTRPLAAYFLEKGHKLKCWMDKLCFLCDLQTHVERASRCDSAFIPTLILSRLNCFGGNLEHGQQEDAHEFMMFAIDKMQSVFLDEFGGEKTAPHRYQETSFVQHIFGGCLLSQVACIYCNKISIRFDHMMDLTVELHGGAESLEECLDQFTAEEWLHGDNMYKCDRCNAYVMARKYLSIRQAPNILMITLKRFQKLNKRVTFPEKLDLRSYMNESEDGNDIYKLYAVVVHVGIHTCGHYICYVKDFGGYWYKIDDDKVSSVSLDEVLSQKAYMLLYSRICARLSCLLPAGSLTGEKIFLKIQAFDSSTTQPVSSEAEADSRVQISLVKSAENAGEDVMAPPCNARLPTRFHDSHSFYSSPKEEESSTGRDVKRCNTSDTTKDLSGTRCQNLSAAKNCAFEKDRRHDISSFTTIHIQKEKSATEQKEYMLVEPARDATAAAKAKIEAEESVEPECLDDDNEWNISVVGDDDDVQGSDATYTYENDPHTAVFRVVSKLFEESDLTSLINMLEKNREECYMSEAAYAILTLCDPIDTYEAKANQARAIAEGLVEVVVAKLKNEELVSEMIGMLALLSTNLSSIKRMVEMDAIPLLFKEISLDGLGTVDTHRCLCILHTILIENKCTFPEIIKGKKVLKNLVWQRVPFRSKHKARSMHKARQILWRLRLIARTTEGQLTRRKW